MNKKPHIILSIVITISLICCSLTACSKKREEPQPLGLGIVIAATSNSATLNFNTKGFLDSLTETIESQGNICCVNADGSPSVVLSGTYSIEEKYRGNKSMIDKLIKAKLYEISTNIETINADDPELDLLESMRLCLRGLSSTENRRRLVVFSTGVSTSGIMSLQDGFLNGDSNKIAESLCAIDAVPDFKNTEVLWYFLGDTDGEHQPKPSPLQLKKLQDIWTAIIESTGGNVIFCTDLPRDYSYQDLPPVTTVKFPEEPPLTSYSSDDFDLQSPQALYEEEIGFEADSDKLRDEVKTMALLNPIAEAMREDPEMTLLICGTTAGDEADAYSYELSEARAAVVREIFIDLGISECRLIIKGLACNNPWHIPSQGTSGALAAQNRRVVLVDANTEIAKNLLSR